MFFSIIEIVNFSDIEVWLDFLSFIKNRSVYDFGIEVTDFEFDLIMSSQTILTSYA